MIHEVTGDNLLSKAQGIAHGVVPNDHMDSGLALEARELWPAMPRDFHHHTHQAHPKPGVLWSWCGVGGVRLYNLLIQEREHGHGARPGRASRATANHCLKRLGHEIENDGIVSLALPRLAIGVDGLEWNNVHPLIRQHLGDLAIPIDLYTT